MNTNVQDFIDAILGSNSKKPIPEALSSISQENITIARTLVELASTLQKEGKIHEAERLKDSIQSLLRNNEKLIEAARQTLNYGF